jgi:hypothetical protein
VRHCYLNSNGAPIFGASLCWSINGALDMVRCGAPPTTAHTSTPASRASPPHAHVTYHAPTHFFLPQGPKPTFFLPAARTQHSPDPLSLSHFCPASGHHPLSRSSTTQPSPRSPTSSPGAREREGEVRALGGGRDVGEQHRDDGRRLLRGAQRDPLLDQHHATARPRQGRGGKCSLSPPRSANGGFPPDLMLL